MEGREVIISWSMTNWITIFLMALGGSLIVGLGWRALNSAMGKKKTS